MEASMNLLATTSIVKSRSSERASVACFTVNTRHQVYHVRLSRAVISDVMFTIIGNLHDQHKHVIVMASTRSLNPSQTERNLYFQARSHVVYKLTQRNDAFPCNYGKKSESRQQYWGFTFDFVNLCTLAVSVSHQLQLSAISIYRQI